MSNGTGTTPLGKIVLAVVSVGVAYGALTLIQTKTSWLAPTAKVSEVPKDLAGITATAPAMAVAEIAAAGSPVQKLSGKETSAGCKVKLATIAWNATMPVHYANGGVNTIEGSLFAKNGVRMNIERIDDYGKIQEEQIKFASKVGGGENCPTEGAAFAIIMGDGYPAYAAGLEGPMKKLDQGFEVVYATGYSYGEDKCMLPVGFDKNPQLARGSRIGAVMRDGDYNICVTWAAQNGIPINPDDKTYDPSAMNFRSVSSFIEADDGLINGFKENLPVVSNGKRTGKTMEVTQNGTATWTPGDVNIARKVGGYVSVASTREYSYQMPAIIIGNRNYMKRNPEMVKGMIRALADAGQAIKTSDSALRQAAEVETLVYKEESADYWAKYAKGVTEADKQGNQVSLGGSRVNTLADNAFLFGLSGNDNLFGRIYKQFGDHNIRYYPELMSEYPKYKSVVNTEYLEAVLKSAPATQVAKANSPKFTENKPMERVVAKRNWSIEFETGKATLRPESLPLLEEMLNQISITSLQVEVRGHTDNVGSSNANLALSRARAETVKQFFIANAPSGFPSNRVTTRGYGDTNPIGDNGTQGGRQLNRRVEVILGTTN